jgi:hypothetical protein
MTPQQWLIERLFGKPGSEQAFANWLDCALQWPFVYALTPDGNILPEADHKEALQMVLNSAHKNDEDFLLRWARGRTALKDVDPDYCRDPRYFLCSAYFLYAIDKLPTQKQLIWTAIRELAVVQCNGYPNALSMLCDELSEEEIAAQIEGEKLEGKPWRRYLKEIGLGGNVLPRAKAGNPHRKKASLLNSRPSNSEAKLVSFKFLLTFRLYAYLYKSRKVIVDK